MCLAQFDSFHINSEPHKQCILGNYHLEKCDHFEEQNLSYKMNMVSLHVQVTGSNLSLLFQQPTLL